VARGTRGRDRLLVKALKGRGGETFPRSQKWNFKVLLQPRPAAFGVALGDDSKVALAFERRVGAWLGEA
jgi:hypothetical protein